jgi:hypothetical protein
MLDVGTNNAQRLEDPLYMGWRHPRITDDQYMEFMDMFIDAVKARWPDVLYSSKILPRRTRRNCSTATGINCAASTMTFRAPPPLRWAH